MAEEKVSELLAVTDDLVNDIGRYGGACRDCADNSGVCPMSGLPCADAGDAIRHVLSAINYGVAHGYLPDPRTPTPVTEDVRHLTADEQAIMHQSLRDSVAVVASPSPPKADGPGEDGWQPIETAPKDTRVMVAWPHAPYDDVPWAMQVARKSKFDGGWRSSLNSSLLSDIPTHWRPLPVSPSIKREA